MQPQQQHRFGQQVTDQLKKLDWAHLRLTEIE